MKKSLLVSLLAGGLALAGCQGTGPNEGVGTLLGAAGGGLLGSQFGSGQGKLAATAAGTLLGAIIGNQLGRSVDQTDQLVALQAQRQALASAPIGRAVPFNNPNTGLRGTVTPLRDNVIITGYTRCRQFRTTIFINGRPRTATGVACEVSPNNWRIVA